jgi:hypothetical protein
VLGTGREINISLEDRELAKLLTVIAVDNGRPDLAANLPALPEAARGDYYKIPLSWFTEQPATFDFTTQYLKFAESHLTDFETYFECLCELHKRRRKYAIILSAQPLPTSVQVAPRALLEFGGLPAEALASWLTWRKWFFDIDNRAGQETGYLFEPILASSLGGTPFSASRSPIRRSKDGSKGRQVDCIVAKDAYEFKLRVTIAASGQGRFGEEVDFAVDARASGYRPILLVLDPTPNQRLADLKEAFEDADGVAYIGDSAWEHLEHEAGRTMATFVERYVRRPIADVAVHAPTLLNLFASASPDRKTFSFKLVNDHTGHEWQVARTENPKLETSSDPEEE